MTEWEEITTKIIKAVNDVETNSQKEKIIKYAVMMFLYKNLENEEIFNNNCEILNTVHYDEIRNKRFGK